LRVRVCQVMLTGSGLVRRPGKYLIDHLPRCFETVSLTAEVVGTAPVRPTPVSPGLGNRFRLALDSATGNVARPFDRLKGQTRAGWTGLMS